jgi:hypothetical protein
MTIEEKRYEDVLVAVQALMQTGRNAFVRDVLIKLAYSILRHYGYEVIDASAQIPKS